MLRSPFACAALRMGRGDCEAHEPVSPKAHPFVETDVRLDARDEFPRAERLDYNSS